MRSLFILLLLVPLSTSGFAQSSAQRWEQLVSQFERHLARDDWRQAYTLVEVLNRETQSLDRDDPGTSRVAVQFSRLADLLRRRDRFGEAERVYIRLLSIRERSLGSDHPAVGQTLNAIGLFYRDQSKFDEAAGVLTRSLSIAEKAFGSEHAEVAAAANNLAMVYRDQANYAMAGPLLQRAVAINESLVGPEHPDLAAALDNLGLLYQAIGRLDRARPILERSVAINEAALEIDDLRLATSLKNLGGIYRELGRLGEARDLYERSLATAEEGLKTNRDHLLLLAAAGEAAEALGVETTARERWQRFLDVFDKQRSMGLEEYGAHLGVLETSRNHARQVVGG